MTTVFHARMDGRFTEVQTNLHRTNQSSNFLGGNFNDRDHIKVPIQFRTERQPSILKDDFSSIMVTLVYRNIQVATALIVFSYDKIFEC